MNQDESNVPVSEPSSSTPNSNSNRDKKGKLKNKEKLGQVGRHSANQAQQDQQPNEKHRPGARLRGRNHDSDDVRISKTLSWLLRHGAQSQGLKIRTDGYVKVDDLVTLSSFSLVPYLHPNDVVF